jgi:hypothetical protein
MENLTIQTTMTKPGFGREVQRLDKNSVELAMFRWIQETVARRVGAGRDAAKAAYADILAMFSTA